MPTTRPRYQVTETPDVARALDAASVRWPDEPRSRLLLRLVALGGRAVDQLTEDEWVDVRAARQRMVGHYESAFPEGYLEELRADWPA